MVRKGRDILGQKDSAIPCWPIIYGPWEYAPRIWRLAMDSDDNTNQVDRVCFHCADVTEAEEHVILYCLLYNDLRNMFFHATNVNLDFINMMS